jgi:hypothetical protein
MPLMVTPVLVEDKETYGVYDLVDDNGTPVMRGVELARPPQEGTWELECSRIEDGSGVYFGWTRTDLHGPDSGDGLPARNPA